MDLKPDLRVLSLGAGVQSTALLAIAQDPALGVDAAIFADTQDEPAWVYEHLAWLEANSRVPIRRATKGSLSAAIMSADRAAIPPLFVRNQEGRLGMLQRQCTREFKIEVVQRVVRELLGLRPRQRAKGRFTVELWLGISIDEAHRMKPNRVPWLKNRWPLIERELTRAGCETLLREHGWPVPKKSACVYCPFHDNAYWRDLRANYPKEWDRAVAFDQAFRERPGKLQGQVFIHKTGQPLAHADLGVTDADGFGNECEGHCGL